MSRLAPCLALAFACARAPSSPDAAPTPDARLTTTETVAADLMATLFPRLAHEARSRPGGTPTVEAVLQAFESKGISTTKGQQVLGAMVHAKYCWQTSTTDGALGFSICEYDTDASLELGRQAFATRGAAFGERTLLVNGRTTLTLRATRPGSEARIEQARSAFAATP